jgi:hypothetical protein
MGFVDDLFFYDGDMMIMCVCVCVCFFFSSYISFYFVSKELMFVAGKQIKKNKMKRALQMIYFLFLFFL